MPLLYFSHLAVFLLSVFLPRILFVVFIVVLTSDDVTGSILYLPFCHLTKEHKLFLHIVPNSLQISF